MRSSKAIFQRNCSALISKIEAEEGLRLTQNPKDENTKCTFGRAHCVRHEPAQTNPRHVAKTTFDISPDAVDGAVILLDLRNAFEGTSNTVHTLANACGLNWGGAFDDSVHFSLQ